ncbi:hypothetical protein LTR84_006166 [Exophiala bonariae]|uniref:Transcription factor domain-containing protein n=1 Tax=Exophiala bonariae TaxID=1690606 RepID=A0AAV9N1Q9_9EURO|nr:hypothetical protein LTR84_006166 [Exophiala bonariae]
MCPTITEPIQDVAVTFLLNEYIRGSQFAYLPDVYSNIETTGVLSSTIKAAGLASLSLSRRQPALLDKALKFYAEAITDVNNALQSQEAAQGDDVLASIMLLSFYEALTLRKPNSPKAWSTHVHGALSLVALRGRKQFQSKIGLEIFKQVANSIKLFCIQNHTRVPSQLCEMLDFIACNTETHDIAFTRPSVTEAFADLRADIAEGIVSEPEDIIAKCDIMLQVVDDSLLSLPPSHRYDHMVESNPSISGHRKFHLQFGDHHIAQMWNTAWMARITLNLMIYEQDLIVSKIQHPSDTILAPNETRRALRARKEVMDATEHICATIPELFRWVPQQVSVSTGYSLIWPLFAAGANPLVSPSIRDFAITQLKHIASEFRLPQAQWAGNMLVAGTSTEKWMHIYHVF